MATSELTNKEKVLKSIFSEGRNLETVEPLVTSKNTCTDICKNTSVMDTMTFGHSESEDYITECIKSLIEYKFATCGEAVLSNNEINTRTLESTNSIMKLLRKYGYTQYRLPGVGECDILGWAQGKDDSDCWIDSFLFSLFANNIIANKLILEVDRKYYETDYSSSISEQYMNNALFCITLYLNLLNSRQALLKKSTVGDIKSIIKWCAVFYILEYFKQTEKTAQYEEILSMVSLNRDNLSIVSGGDPRLLAYFFSKITNKFYSSLEIADYTNTDDIRKIIMSTSINKTTDFFAISLPLMPTGAHAKERYFPVLESLIFKGAGAIVLEAVITGVGDHAKAYTECGIQWRYYDNRVKVTTSSISKTKIRDDLNAILYYKGFTKPGTIMFIYRVTSSFKGFSGGTRKIRRRQNRTLKNVAGGKRKNLTRKIGGWF